MAASLVGLGLMLAAGPVMAQAPALSSPAPAWQAPAAPAAPQPGAERFSWPATQPAEVRDQGAPRQPAPAMQPFPAAQKGQPISLTAAQKMQDRQRASDEITDYSIQLEVPGNMRLFQLESEAALKERMRQEAKKYGERLVFPDEPVLSKETYAGRHFEPLTRLVEPNYVCYGRLLFEQINFERYGWDLGPVTPLLSAGAFYWDVLTLPYHVGTRPCQQYECNAGYCLPGDPVPLMLYPPEISATGAAAEAGVLVGLFFAFP